MAPENSHCTCDLKRCIQLFNQGVVSLTDFESFSKNSSFDLIFGVLNDVDPSVSFCAACILVQNLNENRIKVGAEHWKLIFQREYLQSKTKCKLIQAHIRWLDSCSDSVTFCQYLQTFSGGSDMSVYLRLIPQNIRYDFLLIFSSTSLLATVWQEFVYPYVMHLAQHASSLEVFSSWIDFEFVCADLPQLFDSFLQYAYINSVEYNAAFLHLLAALFTSSSGFIYKLDKLQWKILQYLAYLPINTEQFKDSIFEVYFDAAECLVEKIAKNLSDGAVQKFVLNKVWIFRSSVVEHDFDFWNLLADHVAEDRNVTLDSDFLPNVYAQILDICLENFNSNDGHQSEWKQMFLSVYKINNVSTVEKIHRGFSIEYPKYLSIASLISQEVSINNLHDILLGQQPRFPRCNAEFLTLMKAFVSVHQLHLSEDLIALFVKTVMDTFSMGSASSLAVECLLIIFSHYPAHLSLCNFVNLPQQLNACGLLTTEIAVIFARWLSTGEDVNYLSSLFCAFTVCSENFHFLPVFATFLENLLIPQGFFSEYQRICYTDLFPRLKIHFCCPNPEAIFTILKLLSEKMINHNERVSFITDVFSMLSGNECHCHSFYELVCTLSTVIPINLIQIDNFFLANSTVEDSVELLTCVGKVLGDQCSDRFVQHLIRILEHSNNIEHIGVACKFLEKILASESRLDIHLFAAVEACLKLCLLQTTASSTFERVTLLLFQLNIMHPRQFPLVVRQFSQLIQHNPFLIRNITGQRQLTVFRNVFRKIKLQ